MKIKFCRKKCLFYMIILGGALLRVLCAFWGYPLQLHPDEHTVAGGAMDMLSRHSYEAFVYHRPDHFEIKCCALLFQLYSWGRYRIPAYEAFTAHMGEFYLIARLYTAVFGVLMIPLAYKLLKRLSIFEDQDAGAFFGMALIAFSPIFIQHSAYATPDIPLAFFVLFLSYVSLYYLKTGGRRELAAVCLLTAAAITVKYPAAICCLYAALIVVIRSIREKDYTLIIKHGLFSAAVLIAGIFVIAPNLFTNFPAVVASLKNEGRSTHLGADGLGYFGNIKYYFNKALTSLSYISLIPFAAGVFSILRHRGWKYVSMLPGVFFWIFLSVLALHWERWGLPFYAVYVCVTALGVDSILRAPAFFPTGHKKRMQAERLQKLLGGGIMGILLLNCILSGAALTKFSVTEDTRSAAKRYCDRMEITRENSIYEGYTPLETANGDGSRCDQFVLTEDGVSVTEKMAAKKFYVLSDSYKGRYAGEREKYVFENAVYDRLEKSYELIYRLKGARIDKSGYALKNIFLSIKYLLRHQEYTGGEILIYDLDPELIRITPAEKPGYALALEDNNKKKGGNIILSDRNAGSFAVYRKENRYISIICAETDMALDVTGGVFREGTNVEQWEVTGGRPQEWEIVDGDGCVYLLSSDNMALTYEKDNNVCIKKFEGTAAQRWRMMDAD